MTQRYFRRRVCLGEPEWERPVPTSFSAGDETYEVGRYLEPQLLPDGRLHVDLNYAYNPFCAYGSGWSCPIPPAENHLSVMIPAGERAFRLPD